MSGIPKERTVTWKSCAEPDSYTMSRAVLVDTARHSEDTVTLYLIVFDAEIMLRADCDAIDATKKWYVAYFEDYRK